VYFVITYSKGTACASFRAHDPALALTRLHVLEGIGFRCVVRDYHGAEVDLVALVRPHDAPADASDALT